MEKKQPQIVAEEIHLLLVDTTEFRLNAEEFRTTEKRLLEVAHKLAYNLKDEKLKIELALSFKDEAGNEMLFLTTDYHFRVDKLEQFYDLKEDGTPIFKAMILATVLGIALSTSRGILLEKMNTMKLPNILIPVVSPVKLLKQKP